MKRRFQIFPMPVHSLILWVLWLLLNSFSAGHAVLGAVLAIVIPWFAAPLSIKQPSAGKPLLIIQYLIRLTIDIFISNIAVAKQVLAPQNMLRPGFIAYPLDLNKELPITILASTISLTPGTVSVEFSEDYKWLYIHALNIDVEDEIITEIKERYEQPLQEIFGC